MVTENNKRSSTDYKPSMTSDCYLGFTFEKSIVHSSVRKMCAYALKISSFFLSESLLLLQQFRAATVSRIFAEFR